MLASHCFRVLLPIACCITAVGCGTKAPSIINPGGSAGNGSGGDSNGTSGDGNGGGTGAGLNLPDGGDINPEGGVSDLQITPANPVLEVTIVNGKVTGITGGSDAKGTVPFQAT